MKVLLFLATLLAGSWYRPASSVPGQEPELVGVIGHWRVDTAGITVDGAAWTGQTTPADLTKAADRVFGATHPRFIANGSSTTAFPLAVATSIPTFRAGTLRVQFKLISGAGDHTAGVVFGLGPEGEYRFVRYNTKDGNIALWSYANGQRQVIAHGDQHGQLAIGSWHELVVTIKDRQLHAAITGRPDITFSHVLDAVPDGRVGLWTKREAVTAFRGFRVER